MSYLPAIDHKEVEMFWYRLLHSETNLMTNHRLFFYIFVFSTVEQLTVNMFVLQFCRWPDWNRGSLVSEASSLPLEPQLLLQTFFEVDNVSVWPDGKIIFRYLAIYNSEN